MMRLTSSSFDPGQPIPEDFAFGKRGEPIAFAGNRNPHLAWDGVPDGTRSFALLCIDSDAPTDPATVNRDDAEVPTDQPRAHFSHWAMIDVSPDLREIAAGSCSDGVVAHGKPAPDGPAGARQGLNDYTGWFAGDDAMAGEYRGYDGPCPPFNDARVHRYFFRLFALDCASLGLPETFTADDVLREIQGHVLAEATLMGTYTLRRG